MMLKHILKQIWRQKAANAWLWTELVVITVCLWYITIYLYQTAIIYHQPIGIDLEDVYRVRLGAISSNSVYYNEKSEEQNLEDLMDILTRIRHYPGVESLGLVSRTAPYENISAMGSYGVDSVWVNGYRYKVSPGYFNVFRVAQINGNRETLVEKATLSNTLIVSEKVEKEFAKKGIRVLNTPVKGPGETEPTKTVRAVTPDIRNGHFSRYQNAYYETHPEIEVLETMENTFIYFRANPSADNNRFVRSFHAEMKDRIKLGNYYLQDITPMRVVEQIHNRQSGKVDEMKNRIAILFFLLVNIFLAIIGTFWLRTQERRSEIALYRAMGSTPVGIARRLLSEAFILLVFAFIPALVINYNIMLTGKATLADMEGGLGIIDFFIAAMITFMVISLTIIVGIWFPSRQAMKIEPAMALRDE